MTHPLKESDNFFKMIESYILQDGVVVNMGLWYILPHHGESMKRRPEH